LSEIPQFYGLHSLTQITRSQAATKQAILPDPPKADTQAVSQAIELLSQLDDNAIQAILARRDALRQVSD